MTKISKTIIIISFALITSITSADGEILLGDESDGSRAVPVHLIPLLDEEGNKITPSDEAAFPFSPLKTCGGSDCHNVELITKGWHFNPLENNISPGRSGEPWIYVDRQTCTQIPLSYRPWPGTYKPQQLGITTWQFTHMFGRHFPGGGPGQVDSENPEEILRSFISGRLEANCLSCHNAHPGQNQAEYAIQIARQNLRWAAAGSSELATVTGSAKSMPETFDYKMPDALENPELRPPTVIYRENIFDSKDQVLFDITRNIPNERCYFCHTNLDPHAGEKWSQDEDVHLNAGLKCVDCHRHGVDHNITRGYDNESAASENPLAGALTCSGCHIQDKSSKKPSAGRLGAPIAEHKGIPPVHFEKLTCTACHSGDWPDEKTTSTKTSRAHALGILNVNKSPDALPHIQYPVFSTQSGTLIQRSTLMMLKGGKIGPHKLIWPAFWAQIQDNSATPINIETVRSVTSQLVFPETDNTGSWPDLSEEQIAQVLSSLNNRTDGTPVYIAGGLLYQFRDNGNLYASEHNAAYPYAWPVAHNVRPAAQSLGVNGCTDCHSTDSPFVYGLVKVDTPVLSQSLSSKKMVDFQHLDSVYMKLFAFTFVFRPFLKTLSLIAVLVIGAVLLVYALKSIAYITKMFTGEN
ncbi:MAG: hypothetical protein ACYTFE_03600 [Planctomycetota bacterium]